MGVTEEIKNINQKGSDCMEITLEMIIMIVTALATALFGVAAKKWNWNTKNYIPYQNLVIGLIAGGLAYITGLNSNMLNSILICIFSSMTAGGMYDLKKTGE